MFFETVGALDIGLCEVGPSFNVNECLLILYWTNDTNSLPDSASD